MTLTFDQWGMLKLAPLIPLAPLVGAAVVAALGPRRLRGASHWPVILGVLIASMASAMLFMILLYIPQTEGARFSATYLLYHWMSPHPGVWFDVSFRIDPLAAVMLLIVTGVSLLVIIYSRSYMREHDQPVRGYERFFAFMGLFVFSMCTLVLAGNFLLLYLGWEAVGLCSYLLIGFYYQHPPAAMAAKKAFIVNRIGDVGFALGILCIYLWISPLALAGQNPLDYAVVFQHIGDLSTEQCTIIALLLLCGAAGKSAQLPLHTWLPDAMEGPTPVSALIHAATMVTAGVYMVARCGEIFTASPVAMTVVAIIGSVTALYAGLTALGQYDIKRVLAYSTISQLGYMFLGLGVCAGSAAIFHLATHAFFKALLFLAAGSVMHALAGAIDVRQFGGLRRRLPITYAAFLIGALALAGFPLTSGFFSKHAIIDYAMGVSPVLGILALAGELLTAFYIFRIVFLAFHGPERLPSGLVPHEAGGWMTLPLLLLAAGALLGGYVNVAWSSTGFLDRFLEPSLRAFSLASAGHVETHGQATSYISIGLAIGGIVLAYLLYARRESRPTVLTGGQRFLQQGGYIDRVYDAVVVQPLRGVGALFSFADEYVLDGAVRMIAGVPGAAGLALRRLQTGAMQDYALMMMLCLALTLVVLLTVI